MGLLNGDALRAGGEEMVGWNIQDGCCKSGRKCILLHNAREEIGVLAIASLLPFANGVPCLRSLALSFVPPKYARRQCARG